MRIFGLILIVAAALIPAQTNVMVVHLNDGLTDSLYFNRLDPDVGVTFSKTRMNVGLVDTINGNAIQSTVGYCTGRIDSITFTINTPPPETVSGNLGAGMKPGKTKSSRIVNRNSSTHKASR
jgi:hypothetical protein